MLEELVFQLWRLCELVTFNLNEIEDLTYDEYYDTTFNIVQDIINTTELIL